MLGLGGLLILDSDDCQSLYRSIWLNYAITTSVNSGLLCMARTLYSTVLDNTSLLLEVRQLKIKIESQRRKTVHSLLILISVKLLINSIVKYLNNSIVNNINTCI